MKERKTKTEEESNVKRIKTPSSYIYIQEEQKNRKKKKTESLQGKEKYNSPTNIL